MSEFDTLYIRLNKAQKQAVDTVEGPVMVVAGPGTGKTQVLALRVANILLKTQAKPGNILCLTFTTSGATAMRERLRGMIGAAAYGITIDTIHGFCNDVIASHPQVFEEFSALEQISEVEQIREINRIVDSLLPALELVNKKNPHARAREILSRISDVKREGITLDRLEEVANLYEEEMAGKSKEGTKAHEKNMLAARKFRDFVHIFKRYQERLKETQRYDYDDMIVYVLEGLKKEDWMLQQLQERYLYILVDEFQDTNGAQYGVIEALITPRTQEDVPNIFIVGDDDQAIYRFQGANLKNLLSFHRRFPDAPTIVLTISYRCSQPILDAAGSLIAHNSERLIGTIEGLNKTLVSGKEDPRGPSPVLYRTASDEVEPWVIADLIEERLKSGVPPREIAVLTQKNNELRPIYDVLKARNISALMDGKMNVLEHPLVMQLLSILRAVDKPEHNARLSSAMASISLGCHPADLGRLNQLAIEHGKSLLLLLLSLDEPTSAASAEPWHDRECLVHIRDILLDLHQNIGNRTLVLTIETVLKQCGLLPDADKEGFDPLDFAALQAFFEYIKSRSYEEKGYDFYNLMSDLEVYTNSDYGLRLNYSLPHLTEEGVELMTAHQSKGLEFQTVILSNFKENQWDKKRSPGGLSVPADLLFGTDADTKKFEQNQDERRVAFVAFTRAKEELIMMCPHQSAAGTKMRDISPSGFFTEAGELPEEVKEVKDPARLSTLLYKPVIQLDESFKAFLRQKLENLSLSVTALNHFLEDPLLFLESDLLRMPQTLTRSLIYGNAVHHALKQWGISAQRSMPLGRDTFLQMFDNYLVEREILTEAERHDLLLLGQQNLPRYYNERLSENIPTVFRVEAPLAAHIHDVPIKGKIDRIDALVPDSKFLRVIDFKTGSPKTEKQILDEKSYHRQLVFYALLMEQALPMYEAKEFTLDFVGEGIDGPVDRTFTVSAHEKEELKKLIQAVWNKVIHLDFTPVEV